MSENYDFLFKVLLVGDSSVGKTSMLLRYTDETFAKEFQTTIGVDFRIKTLTINDQVAKLQLWDTAGQDRYRRIVSSYYRGAHGLIIVYDITSVSSFEHVPEWLDECNQRTNLLVPKLLIGNKSDLNAQRKITTEQGKELAETLGMQFIETSAKNSCNINEVFSNLSQMMVDANRRQVKVSQLISVGKTVPTFTRRFCCL